ncbi:MAG: glycosyltransferase [Patescibacteria group bacterium]|jgi:glycosyltransferase involved in cell wall biosynthesis
MKISFIIPALNEEKLVLRTLRSLQCVRGKDVEIILSDDGSSDKTCTHARPLVDEIVLLSQPHSTIGTCRNRGAKQASGDVLWFLDCDSSIPNLPAALTYVQQQFTADPELVGLTVHSYVYAGERKLVDHFWLGQRNWLIWVTNILGLGQGSGECLIVRRETFMQIHGFNEQLTSNEDHDLFFRLSRLGKTRLSWKFYVEISPRRFRVEGWNKVLWTWFVNWIRTFIFRKPNPAPWERRD